MKRIAPRPVLAALLLLGAVAATRAGDEAVSAPAPASDAAAACPYGDGNWNHVWRWPVLTGDWSGARPRLAERGVTFCGIYDGEILASLTGGRRAGSTYMGCLYLMAHVDGDKFLPWKGFAFQVATLEFNGSSLSNRYVGDLFNTSVDDLNDTWRLWELWAQQSFLDDRLVVRVGQYAPYFQFAVTPDATLFDNICFQRVGVLSVGGNLRNFLSFSLPAPGVQIKVAPTKQFYVMSAIYVGSPDATAGTTWDNGSSTKLNIYADQGALTLYEAGYLLNQEKGAPGLPGLYKVGAAYHSQSRFTTAGVRSDDYAVYGIADQTVWRGAGDGAPSLALFARAGGAPGNLNLVDFYADGGLVGRGLVPGRPADVAGLAAGYAHVTDDTAALPGAAGRDFEAVVQATYRYQVNPWWSVQPIAKFSIHPGGSDAQGNALIVGMETTVYL